MNPAPRLRARFSDVARRHGPLPRVEVRSAATVAPAAPPRLSERQRLIAAGLLRPEGAPAPPVACTAPAPAAIVAEPASARRCST